MLLLKIHWIRVTIWPFLSEEAWHGRVPMCAERERKTRGDWTPDISPIPHCLADAPQRAAVKNLLCFGEESLSRSHGSWNSPPFPSIHWLCGRCHIWGQNHISCSRYSLALSMESCPFSPLHPSAPPLQWPLHLLRPGSHSCLFMPGTALTFVSAASTLLNLPEPRDAGRCCIFIG